MGKKTQRKKSVGNAKIIRVIWIQPINSFLGSLLTVFFFIVNDNPYLFLWLHHNNSIWHSLQERQAGLNFYRDFCMKTFWDILTLVKRPSKRPKKKKSNISSTSIFNLPLLGTLPIEISTHNFQGMLQSNFCPRPLPQAIITPPPLSHPQPNLPQDQF